MPPLLIKAEPICRQSGNAQLLFHDLWDQSRLLTMAPPETMTPATLSKRRKALVREASELAHGLGYEEIAQSLRDQADAL